MRQKGARRLGRALLASKGIHSIGGICGQVVSLVSPLRCGAIPQDKSALAAHLHKTL